MILQHFSMVLASAAIVSGYLVSLPVAEEHVVHCGNSTDEAKELGCLFDMYSFAYYSPACYNKAHHDDFLSTHRYEFQWTLKDKAHTHIPVEETLQGIHEGLYTTSWNFHDTHCTYEWQRLIRALAEERPLDKKLSQNSHSFHCSTRLLDRNKIVRMGKGSEANMLFGSCGLTAEQMHEFGFRSEE